MVMMEFIYTIYKKDSLIWTEFLCGLEIPLNLVFNQKKKKKNWEKSGKNISPTPLKIPTK